jgi:hypothetical protein
MGLSNAFYLVETVGFHFARLAIYCDFERFFSIESLALDCNKLASSLVSLNGINVLNSREDLCSITRCIRIITPESGRVIVQSVSGTEFHNSVGGSIWADIVADESPNLISNITRQGGNSIYESFEIHCVPIDASLNEGPRICLSDVLSGSRVDPKSDFLRRIHRCRAHVVNERSESSAHCNAAVCGGRIRTLHYISLSSHVVRS